MTPLVLVILAVMWVLVLVPPLLRSRTDGRPNTSISSFQRQLRTLQRTGGYPSRGTVTYLRSSSPQGRAPAYQRQAPAYYDDGYGAPVDDRYARSEQPTTGVTARSPQRPRRPLASTRPSPTARRAVGPCQQVSYQREALRRRRQNVLFTLMGSTFVTAVIAFGMNVPALRWLFVLSVVALVGYILLLIQVRRAADLRAYRSSWSRMAA